MPDEAGRRLAIEHDDRTWSALEVMPLASDHGLPFVADTLHNSVLPSTPALSTRELLSLASKTWHRLGLRPKHHLASQQQGGKPGAHADRIQVADWRELVRSAEHAADVMLEAKDKDLALFALRRVRLKTPREHAPA